jgi:anti-anti-sigma regulatory factor
VARSKSFFRPRLRSIASWHRPRPADRERVAAWRAETCARGVVWPREKKEPMATTDTNARYLPAPEILGLDTRGSFRDAAVGLLEQLPETSGTLIVDFDGTRRIDSAGLGALMLVQRRASERRQRVVLRNLRDEFRFLLVLTKLDDLFDIESRGE